MKHTGFTLIELLIVVSVLGILASITIVLINPVAMQNRARDAAALSSFNKIVTSFVGYHATYNDYPLITDVNCDGSNDETDCPLLAGISGATYLDVNTQRQRYVFTVEGIPVIDISGTNWRHDPGTFQYIRNTNGTCLATTSYSGDYIYAWRPEADHIQICTFSGIQNPGSLYCNDPAQLTCEDL